MEVEHVHSPLLDSPGTAARHLDDLYRSWRILDMLGETAATMPPAWLHILNLARNLIDGRALPGVVVPAEVAALVHPERETFTTRLRTVHGRRVIHPLAGDTTVQPLRNLFDLPQLSMPDLLLHDLSPELFEYLLLSGDINAVYTTGLTPAVEEYDEVIEERVPAPSPLRRKRQQVYALLDVSNSMRDHNKMIFAKALMLAYLLTAFEEQARIRFRTFGNRVHERTDCFDLAGFSELALRILRLTPDGSTDIRAALATAIADIRDIEGVDGATRKFADTRTEVLLISDCESDSIPYVPEGIKLHTVHLKSGILMRSYQEGFDRIRAESTTFHQIDTSNLVLPQLTRERWLLRQDGRPLDADAPTVVTGIATEPPPATGARRAAVRAAYDRMAADDRDRSGSASGTRMGGSADMAGFAWSNPFRAMWRVLSRTFHRPHHRPASGHASLGLEFRQRK